MQLTLNETKVLLKEDLVFTQLGFSMLLERLKKLYVQDPSQSMLQKCTGEINAFLGKFKMIMTADYENIAKSLKSLNDQYMTVTELQDKPLFFDI